MKLHRFIVEMWLPLDVDQSTILEKLQGTVREICEDSDDISALTNGDDGDDATDGEILTDEILNAVENGVSVQESSAPLADHTTVGA